MAGFQKVMLEGWGRIVLVVIWKFLSSFFIDPFLGMLLPGSFQTGGLPQVLALTSFF